MTAVFTCKHGRDQVNALFLENMRWLRTEFDLEVFMVTTNGETFEEDWIHTIKFPNNPLGQKWNASIKLALTSKADKFMGMGDDDLISQKSFQELIDTDYSHVGTQSVYFIEPYQHRAVLASYPNKCDKLVGAGRTFTREAVENSSQFVNVKLRREINNGGNILRRGQVLNLNMAQARYLECRGVVAIVKASHNFEFFGASNNSGMDHTSDMNLVLANYLPKAIKLSDEIIDVKTEENIWTFDRRSRGKEAIPVKYEKAIEWLPGHLKDQLHKLKPIR